MSKLVINNNDNMLMYPVKSESSANISTVLDEWIRFSSYINPEEVLLLNELNNKTIEQLSTEEIEIYLKIKEQIEISELFIKYKNRNCSKEEHDRVVKYMDISLRYFMQEKLTKEEIEQSYEMLSEFRKKTKSELIEYIDRQMVNYDNLTILEAYILYEVKEIKYNKDNIELNDIIRNEQIERKNNLRKSLLKDYGIRI